MADLNPLERILKKMWANPTLAGVAIETRRDFFRIFGHLEHATDLARVEAAMRIVEKLMIAIAKDDHIGGASASIALMLVCERYPKIKVEVKFDGVPASLANNAWLN